MKPWFQVTALATAEKPTAEVYLRGYIGMTSTGYDYWTGETYETGGAGTVAEFEAALKALGKVEVIQVYLTSEGGNVTDGIAIHNILARQTARIVCTIDGYAFSIATVIAMAADELKIAANGLMMIHDAEFWACGSDIKALQDGIKTLETCNDAIASAYQAKAGGTVEEWQARMTETTWLTGRDALTLKLVDTVMEDVALTAYAPASGATLARRMPDQFRALFDKAASPVASNEPTKTDPMLRPRTPLFTAATEVPPAGGAPAGATPPPAPVITAALTQEAVAQMITAATQPLQVKIDEQATTITAQAGELKHLKGLSDHGLGAATAAAGAPVTGAPPVGAPKADLSKMTAHQLIALGRQNAAQGGATLPPPKVS